MTNNLPTFTDLVNQINRTSQELQPLSSAINQDPISGQLLTTATADGRSWHSLAAQSMVLNTERLRVSVGSILGDSPEIMQILTVSEPEIDPNDPLGNKLRAARMGLKLVDGKWVSIKA